MISGKDIRIEEPDSRRILEVVVVEVDSHYVETGVVQMLEGRGMASTVDEVVVRRMKDIQ
jgi:hypothetical protein